MIHFCAYNLRFEMELISLFYKMYYNIRSGLGLQYVIVLFPDQSHLFFWSLVEKDIKKNALRPTQKVSAEETGVFVLFLFCLNTCL